MNIDRLSIIIAGAFTLLLIVGSAVLLGMAIEILGGVM